MGSDPSFISANWFGFSFAIASSALLRHQLSHRLPDDWPINIKQPHVPVLALPPGGIRNGTFVFTWILLNFFFD